MKSQARDRECGRGGEKAKAAIRAQISLKRGMGGACGRAVGSGHDARGCEQGGTERQGGWKMVQPAD